MLRRFFKKLLTPPMMIIAAMIMFFEEWLWDKLTAFMAMVARAPALRRLEARIAGLSPYPAMGIFLLPGLALLPVNVFAVWITAAGHALAGTSILIATKLVGTAILARLFTVCRPALLTVNWFRQLYEAIGRLKSLLYTSAPWVAVLRWKNAMKARITRLLHRWRGGHLKRRWRAVAHLVQRRRQRRSHDRTDHPVENSNQAPLD